MLNFIKKLFPVEQDEPKGSLIQKEEVVHTSTKEMLKHISHEWSIRVKTRDSDKDPIYREVCRLLERKVTPIQLGQEDVLGFSRYKGDLWGMYQRKRFTGFFFFVDNPVHLHILIEKKKGPSDNKENILLGEKLRENFTLTLPSTKDIEYEKKIVGTFVQNTLDDIQENLSDGDFLIVNRTGIFLGFKQSQSEETLNQMVAMMLDVHHSLRFLE